MGVASIILPLLKHLTDAVRTTADAGRDLMELSVERAFQGQRAYFVGTRQEASATVSHDREVQRQLWEACWKWAGMSEEETVLQNAAIV